MKVFLAAETEHRQLEDLWQADFGRVHENISSFAKEKFDNWEFCGRKVTPVVCFCNYSTQKSRLFFSVKADWVYMINTWLLTNMKLLFSCSTRYSSYSLARYLTCLLLSLMRERVEHSKRNSLSKCTYVLFSIYWIRTKWPTLSYSLDAKSLKIYHIQRISMRDVARSLSDRFSYGLTIIDCWPQKSSLMNVKPSNLLISAPAKISKG